MEPKQNHKSTAKEGEHLPPDKPSAENQKVAPPVNDPLQTASKENPSLLPHPPEPQTTNIEPQISETMEVHHHGHVHEKKKWLEYVFQFFMLFLAVFCGFLAEYQLEHVIENNREKQYIESIIEDIKLDTASINKILAEKIVRKAQMDSLFTLLNNPGDKTATNEIYYYSRLLLRNTEFAYHNRTISQIKNSGAMRLIKKDCSDSITIYDNEVIGGIFSEEQIQFRLRERARDYIGNIFDASVYNVMIDSLGKLSKLTYNPPLLTTDKIILNQFSLHIHYLKNAYIFSSRQLKAALVSATALIGFLKKEYHLESE